MSQQFELFPANFQSGIETLNDDLDFCKSIEDEYSAVKKARNNAEKALEKAKKDLARTKQILSEPKFVFLRVEAERKESARKRAEKLAKTST